MTADQLHEVYAQRKSTFEQSLKSVKKKINLISNIRIGIALLIILLVYLGYSQPGLFYAIPVLIIVFLILVQHHGKAFDEKVHLENLVKINQNEVSILKGDFKNQHAGLEFFDASHPYAHDLDLFGDGSLFQYTNRCNTLGGRKKFSDDLLSPISSREKIVSRQQSLQELTSLIDFRQHVQAGGMEIEELPTDRAQLAHWAKQPAFLFGKKFYELILWIVPTLTIGFAIGAFFIADLKLVAVALSLFQWAISRVSYQEGQ